MKARIKATGDIVEISEDCSYVYTEHFDKSYNINELEFLGVKENSFPNDEDYWTRLEHHYAGMAMQGILSNQEYVHSLVQKVVGGKIPNLAEGIIKNAEQFAHALVEKYKENEKAMH